MVEEVGNGLKVSRATHTECEAEEEPLKRSFPYVRSNTNRGAADQQQEIKIISGPRILEAMSLLTPTFSSFPLFTSFSEESRKFEAEADHLWADMQSSMLKTSPNGSKGSSEDLINNNTSKLFQKHNFGENNSWSDIHKAMFERQTLQSPLKDEIHSVTTNSDGSFEVSVAFTGFKADELSIKVLDNSLVIEAKHEEKNPETGKVQNYIQMQRRFLLPTSFDTNALTSSLSEDGVLTIAAPSKVKHQVLSPKKIEITQASSGVPETH